MLKQFEPFYNNWCSYEYTFTIGLELWFDLNLRSRFFNQLKFDPDSLRGYRIQAAERCSEMLGDRPVLCLSGGVDSQAMIQCWQEAGLDFDVAILVFNNKLNHQDVDHARLYCEKNNITPVEIPLNIARFLATESYDLACKYKCNSPHFATHYKLFDLLRERGYTGVCAGGTHPFRYGNIWKNPMSAATMNFVEYSRISNYPAMGNFLGYSPELAWTLGMLSFPVSSFEGRNKSYYNLKELDQLNNERYSLKVEAMSRHGLNVIPQSQKFTGFELVKDYFAKKAGGDGWAFERNFRHPLEQLFPVTGTPILTMPAGTKKTLDKLYSQQLLSSFGTGSGIAEQLGASDNRSRKFYTRRNPQTIV